MFLRLLNLGWLCFILVSSDSDDDRFLEGFDLVENLKANMRSNLDLPKDEEYEDLRAELLAYHEALKSIVQTKPNSRRSLKSTPCWRKGGICVLERLCQGVHFLTEIPGCKDKNEICCFTWNQFRTRDMTEFGIDNAALPWHQQREIGGKGVVAHDSGKSSKKKKKNKLSANKESPPINPNDDNYAILGATSKPEEFSDGIEDIVVLKQSSTELKSDEKKVKETKRALFDSTSDDDKPIALVISTGKK